MSERGNYRALHTVLVDDPDFQALSPDAKLLFYTGRLQLGPTGIGVLYDSALADQTGMGIDRVRDGMGDLIAGGWIERQHNIVWFVNGLRFDPSLSVNNEKHVMSIQKHLSGLPKLAIVNKFADHYGLEAPFANPCDTHWHTPSDGYGEQGIPITEKGNTEEGNGTGDSLPTVENTPGEDAVVETDGRRTDPNEFFDGAWEKDGDCWRWTRACDPKGYGLIWNSGYRMGAHRFSFERDRGRPVKKDHDLHHSCENKWCVNPKHLEEMTRGDHMKHHHSREDGNRWSETVTACRKHLWLDEDPPDGRTVGQELSVAKQLCDRWNLEPPDVAEAVEGFAKLRDAGFWKGWIDRNEPAKMLALNRTPEDEQGIPVVIRSLHEMRKGEPAKRSDSGLQRLEVSA